jgi:hypothetical protein
MDKTGKKEPRMILALDLETTDEALDFLRRWGKRIKYVKIGPGLFAQGGTDFITRLREDGRKIFLDLKLQIPFFQRDLGDYSSYFRRKADDGICGKGPERQKYASFRGNCSHEP